MSNTIRNTVLTIFGSLLLTIGGAMVKLQWDSNKELASLSEKIEFKEKVDDAQWLVIRNLDNTTSIIKTEVNTNSRLQNEIILPYILGKISKNQEEHQEKKKDKFSLFPFLSKKTTLDEDQSQDMLDGDEAQEMSDIFKDSIQDLKENEPISIEDYKSKHIEQSEIAIQ